MQPLRAMVVLLLAAALAACATAYQARPLPFKLPERYPNAVQVEGVTVAAEAFDGRRKAAQAFGFDVLGAGLLPVQVVFDHRGKRPVRIDPAQTFLEDDQGRLWPVLEERFAYERVTRFQQTREIFKEGAYAGFLGGVAGALVGAAVGVVEGEDVGRKAAEGAAAGAAAGAVLGGAGGLASAEEAREKVMEDFRAKSLRNRAVHPGNLAYGFLFFPAEAKRARSLRLQLVEEGTGRRHTLTLPLHGAGR